MNDLTLVIPAKYEASTLPIVLKELEAWAKENSYTSSVLETGFKQPEAIALYKKNEYSLIPNYGQYEGVQTSVCFKKLFQ